ncbi:hypothetical protein PtB15_14B146 [Puccinia triticina]|nr:hypothetical protein PtB15_14B146 [Puccinia triticina]
MSAVRERSGSFGFSTVPVRARTGGTAERPTFALEPVTGLKIPDRALFQPTP